MCALAFGRTYRYFGRMTTIGEIGKRVEVARRAELRSVSWIAERTGIPDKTLRRRLDHPEAFKLSELNAVAEALGCHLEDFLRTPAAEEVRS